MRDPRPATDILGLACDAIPVFALGAHSLPQRMRDMMRSGWRLGLLSARRARHEAGLALIALMLDPNRGQAIVLQAGIGEAASYRSLTPIVPQAHWFERAIRDLFGVLPEGHPRLKGIVSNGAWAEGFHPLSGSSPSATGAPPRQMDEFMTVQGAGVYEVPVGPIHAGIIEPGHFRFSCVGEVIQNLEIRLGYLHRGAEQQLVETPWRHARFLAESVSSDTPIGHSLAHATALEQILGIAPSDDAVTLRAVALEIERLSSHIGDLGGVCSDIGYAGGAAILGRLRGRSLGLGERLTGSRFMTAFVLPGGVAQAPTSASRREIARECAAVGDALERAAQLLLDNAGALERMTGVGTLRPSLARDFGLVGPAGRASGVAYDVREAFRQRPYVALDWLPAAHGDGDVLARVTVRVEEARQSARMIQALLSIPGSESEGNAQQCALPETLPPDRVGLGIVESWRGELIHLVFTDPNGKIDRYCVKDPSFNNWTGLSIAARGQLLSDFPLCNKSFGLSYSGSDL